MPTRGPGSLDLNRDRVFVMRGVFWVSPDLCVCGPRDPEAAANDVRDSRTRGLGAEARRGSVSSRGAGLECVMSLSREGTLSAGSLEVRNFRGVDVAMSKRSAPVPGICSKYKGSRIQMRLGTNQHCESVS
jgi:hypothetical protein